MSRRTHSITLILAALTTITISSPASAESDRARAEALKKHNLSLAGAIAAAEKAVPNCPALLALVDARKGVGVNLDLLENEKVVGIRISADGSAARETRTWTSRVESEYPDIMKRVITQQYSLIEAVKLAEKESDGVALDAWWFLKNRELRIMIRLFVDKKSEQVTVNPSTREIERDDVGGKGGNGGQLAFSKGDTWKGRWDNADCTVKVAQADGQNVAFRVQRENGATWRFDCRLDGDTVKIVDITQEKASNNGTRGVVSQPKGSVVVRGDLIEFQFSCFTTWPRRKNVTVDGPIQAKRP